jgi:hypothetical protein
MRRITLKIYRCSADHAAHLLFAGVLLVYTVFLFETVSRDEGAFLLMGQGILDGVTPYLGYVDHKPPGIYYFSAALLSVYDSPISVRAGVLLVNTATAAGLFFVGREPFGKRVGAASALIYLAGILLYQGFYVLTEQFVALFGVAVLFLLYEARSPGVSGRERVLLHLGIGICVGLSIVFKQTGGALAIGAVALYTLTEGLGGFLRNVGAMGVGATVTVGAVAGAYYLAGGLQELLHWVVLIHLPGGSYGATGLRGVLRGILSNVLRFPMLWALVALGVLGHGRSRRRYGERYYALVLLGVASSLPLFVRGYPHYWIQILPFASLFGSIALVDHYDAVRSRASARVVRPLLALLLVVLLIPSGTIVAQGGADILAGDNLREDYRVGEYVRGETDPSERILALTAEPKVYYLSDRRPIGENIYYLPANRGNYNNSTIIENVAAAEPPLVVVRTPCRDYVETACAYVRANYDVTRRLGPYRIYERDADE